MGSSPFRAKPKIGGSIALGWGWAVWIGSELSINSEQVVAPNKLWIELLTKKKKKAVDQAVAPSEIFGLLTKWVD